MRLGACTIGRRAPVETHLRAPSYDDPRPFPRGCTPLPPGGGGEASPPRHSSHCSHSRNPMGKPIWLARGVVIVTNPVMPTLGRKVRDLAMTSGRRRCSGSLERYSENGDKEHEKGDDHEDRHRSQHGASAVRRGNTHVQGTCMPRLILRLLRPMWSTSGTGPPTCADVEGVLPGVVAPVRAAGGGWGRSLRGKVTHAGDPGLPCYFLTHPANNQRTPVTPGSCGGHRVTPWMRRGRRTDDEPT